jgi:hypothetical protein
MLAPHIAFLSSLAARASFVPRRTWREPSMDSDFLLVVAPPDSDSAPAGLQDDTGFSSAHHAKSAFPSSENTKKIRNALPLLLGMQAWIPRCMRNGRI